MRLKLNDFPNNVIEQYNLGTKVTKDDCVYLKVCKLMYGLSQTRILAQQLLEDMLNTKDHKQSVLMPGFWTHIMYPISFTLCVKDFGVEYDDKEHTKHLVGVFHTFYTISYEWEGRSYLRIKLN